MIKKIAFAALPVTVCLCCYRGSPELGLHTWGYGVATGQIVIGRPLSAGGKCEPFLEVMKTCTFHEVYGADTAWIMALVRHGKVYHLEVQAQLRDPHHFYDNVISTFGDPVRGAAMLYWQNSTICVRLNPANPSDARGPVQLQMWDGREENGCHFE